MLKVTKCDGGFVVSGTTRAGASVLQVVTGARKQANAWAAAAYDGRAVAGVGGKATVLKSFAEAAAAYVAAGHWLSGIEDAMAHFGDEWVGGITAQDVLAYAKGAYATASRINRNGIAPARAVLNYAQAQGWRQDRVSVPQVREVKRAKGAAEDGWVEAFMAQAERMGVNYLGYAELALVLLTTGRRTDEMLRVRWADIDWSKGQVRLARTKNGDAAMVVLHDVVLKRLRLLRAAQASVGAGVRADVRDRLTCGLVFGIRTKTQAWERWREVCEAAGIEALTPHAAGRHTFATRLDEAGMTANAIAALGGWKSVRLVQETYIHNGAAKRGAAEVVAKGLLGISDPGLRGVEG